ncbi:hypothetical protein ABZY44_35720 [Streptomyces sp. NPDC006544]|uniref:hypothetical protein n=1 Tax=Streptomyces sp. NPDC006544 TaxID=3154583 RepID=UPI0033A7ACE1
MSDPRAPQGDDDYSATVLGSHWISGPPEDPAGTGTERLRPPVGTPGEDATRRLETPGEDATRRLETPGGDATPETPGGDATRPSQTPGEGATREIPGEGVTRPSEHPGAAVPDRVEGSVLRFGPGVTAALPAPFPLHPRPEPPRRKGEWRRYALATAVLLAVLAYLGWQRYGPALEVRDVAVATDAGGPACDATADVVAVVHTNGRAGVLTYRWLRSDGTQSEQLTERVPSGRREARLHLLWTFQGAGTYPAKAELQLVSPQRRTAAAEFTYRCRP